MATRRIREQRDERGVVLLEFAFVIGLFALLVMGLVTFGYAYLLKDNMTHAAHEGARTAVVTQPAPNTDRNAQPVEYYQPATSAATTAASQAVTSFGSQWSAGGTVASTLIYCNDGGTVTDPLDSSRGDLCVKVALAYDYLHHPLLPPFPGISSAIPNTMNAVAISKLPPS
jgi:Flp pilus assembly protein TadG